MIAPSMADRGNVIPRSNSMCRTDNKRTTSIKITWIRLSEPNCRDFLFDSVAKPEAFKTSNTTRPVAPSHTARLAAQRLAKKIAAWTAISTVAAIDSAV